MKISTIWTVTTALLIVFFTHVSSAQSLVDFEELIEYTAAEIDDLPGAGSGLQTAKNDIRVYKLWYETNDVSGRLDTASGIVAFPINTQDENWPRLVYQHGTTDREDVPSDLGTTAFGTAFFAGQGYFSIGPDLLGLGEARGFHPYIHAESEASAAYDMILAGEELAEEINIEVDDDIYITGYSQGGHSSMALHQLIENLNPDNIDLQACAHLSGPYSVSGIMLDRVLDGNTYIPGLAFIPYAVLGYQEAYDLPEFSLENVFKSQFIPTIESFRLGTSNLTEMTTLIGVNLTIAGETLSPRNILLESFVDTLENGNPDTNPVLLALQDNDLFDWTPQTPTRLYYCEADEQVPFENAPITEMTMNNNGAPDVLAESRGATLDHGECFFPAMAGAAGFFDSFVTSTENTLRPTTSIDLYPSPVSDVLHVELEDGHGAHGLALTSESGQECIKLALSPQQNRYSIPVHQLSAGIYFVKIFATDFQEVRKVMIRK